jgi:hypothetical protein
MNEIEKNIGENEKNCETRNMRQEEVGKGQKLLS